MIYSNIHFFRAIRKISSKFEFEFIIRYYIVSMSVSKLIAYKNIKKTIQTAICIEIVS